MDFRNYILPLLVIWISSYFILSFLKLKLSPKRLPPGPFSLPIIGNLSKLGSKPHKSLCELSKLYGPLMTLHLGYQPTVVVSSVFLARQVLQKYDASFSNRNVPDATTVYGHHLASVVLMPPTNKWRNLRKICTTRIFSNSRLEANRDLRRKKVQEMLSYVRSCSDSETAVNIGQAAFTTSLNLLSNIIFSIDMANPSSEAAGEFKELVWAIMVESGTPNLADFFPILKAIDPQGNRRRFHKLVTKLFKIFNVQIDQRLQRNKSLASLEVNDVLDELLSISKEGSEFQQSDILHLLMDLFAAGTDTTSSTIEWAMAELLRNPEKLKKAQKELQEVLTNESNLVEEADIARLPYLQALVKETLRLHPSVPFLVPRKVDTEVELSGFMVPKNAQVLVNIWAMGRDPSIWENPNSFEPERFLGSNIDFKGHDFELIPFGAGRRICPGMPLANRILHCVLGSLIHCFNWRLEDEVTAENLDMEDKFGFTLQKAQPLFAIPSRA